MKPSSRVPRRYSLLAWLAVLALCHGTTAAPQLSALYPAGGQVGQTVQVTAVGSFPNWPVTAYSPEPGLSITADAASGVLKISIAQDAPLGVHTIRLYDKEGASEPRRFVVGHPAEIQESEPNNRLREAQSMTSLPCVINGRLQARGDVDTYSISLVKGQTLVADVDAQFELGSPMDTVLQFTNPRGITLEQQEDQQGLDPFLTYTAPADGVFLLRIFAFPETPSADVSLAGGDNFIYRVTLTTGPFVDFVMPLAASSSSANELIATGFNLDNGARGFSLPPEPAGHHQAMAWSADLAKPYFLDVLPGSHLVAAETDDPALVQMIPLPATVTGRIEKKNDRDTFEFPARMGKAIRCRILSRAMGSPMDPVLTLLDPSGMELASADDLGELRDAELRYQPPKDGPLRITVKDLHGHFGEKYVYRLQVEEPAADFALVIAKHEWVATPATPLEIEVNVDRQEGFADEIQIQLTGLPPGSSAPLAVSKGEGDSAKAVKLLLTPGSEPFSGPIGIVGRSTGTNPLERKAEFSLQDGRIRQSEIWLTIRPAN